MKTATSNQLLFNSSTEYDFRDVLLLVLFFVVKWPHIYQTWLRIKELHWVKKLSDEAYYPWESQKKNSEKVGQPRDFF